jgi:hypothetical protein
MTLPKKTKLKKVSGTAAVVGEVTLKGMHGGVLR